MTVLWLMTDAHRAGELKDHQAEYIHILELCLGFGVACTSNWAQRFADGLLRILRRHVDREERALLMKETKPERVAYIKKRLLLSEKTGINQLSLWWVGCYTDDSLFQAVGYERYLRVLKRWHWLTTQSHLVMAGAAKRQAGNTALVLGLDFHAGHGAIVIPATKRVAISAKLQAVAEGRKMEAREPASITGGLVHLAPFTGTRRYKDLIAPFHRWTARCANLGPAVQVTADAQTRKAAADWIEVLNTRYGVFCISAVEDEPRALPSAANGVTCIASGDAAKSGAPKPGLAGYMHGLVWVLRLFAEDHTGIYQIPITALELITVALNILIFGPLMPRTVSVTPVFLTDSDTSVTNLSEDSAKAALQRLIVSWLHDRPEYKAIEARALIGQNFGHVNIVGDGLSRGYDELIAELAAQMNLRLTYLELPDAAYEIMNMVKTANMERVLGRPLSKDERKLGRRYSSDEQGDAVSDTDPQPLVRREPMNTGTSLTSAGSKQRPPTPIERQHGRMFSSDEDADAVERTVPPPWPALARRTTGKLPAAPHQAPIISSHEAVRLWPRLDRALTGHFAVAGAAGHSAAVSEPGCPPLWPALARAQSARLAQASAVSWPEVPAPTLNRQTSCTLGSRRERAPAIARV
jgi:hypothetical protein